MIWKTFVTLVVCNVLKGKVAGGWEEGTGVMTKKRLDAMMVSCQFLGLFVVLVLKMKGGGREERGERGWGWRVWCRCWRRGEVWRRRWRGWSGRRLRCQRRRRRRRRERRGRTRS